MDIVSAAKELEEFTDTVEEIDGITKSVGLNEISDAMRLVKDSLPFPQVAEDPEKELNKFIQRWDKNPATTTIYFLDDFLVSNRNTYASRINEPLEPSLLDLDAFKDSGKVFDKNIGLWIDPS